MKMSAADGTVLAKALTTIVEPHVKVDQDVMFRMHLVRSSLRVEGQPSLDTTTEAAKTDCRFFLNASVQKECEVSFSP